MPQGIHQIIESLMDNLDFRDNAEWKSQLIRAKTEGQGLITRLQGPQEISLAYYLLLASK